MRKILNRLKMIWYLWSNKKLRNLRKLPWYMLCGPNKSGKSSLLKNIDLNFYSLDTLWPALLKIHEVVDGVIWHINDEMVICDIELDSNTNKIILPTIVRLIKCFWLSNPIKGLIVTLSLPDLLSQSEQVTSEQCASLKSSVHFLQQKLKIKLPVYLLFAQCDLIAGFQEFFADLTQEERNQLWGISFAENNFSENHVALTYFDEEFDKLMQRLHAMLLIRLEGERDQKKCAQLAYFPQQMQMCKQVIKDILLFNNEASIRGMYFLSNHQDNQSNDFLMKALAKKFDLSVKSPMAKKIYSRTYFVNGLFPQVILPESDRIVKSGFWQRVKNMDSRFVWLGPICMILFFSTGLFISAKQNIDNIQTLQNYLPEYQQAINHYAANDKNLLAVFPLLEILQNMRELYANASYKWLLYFQLYQPYRLNSVIEKIWLNTLNKQFLPRVAWHLEDILRQNVSDPEILYQTLKAYLVFSATADADPQWLLSPIISDRRFLTNFSEENGQQLINYLQSVVQYPINSLQLNEQLIARVRQTLSKIPPAFFAYDEMKQSDHPDLQSFNFSQMLGAEFSQIFVYQDNSLQNISSIFTLQGFHELHKNQTRLLIEHTARVYSTLGLAKSLNKEDLTNQMTPDLWLRYNRDYINAWQKLLNNVKVMPFDNIPQAIQVLNGLTDKKSILQQLLLLIKENTETIQGENFSIAEQFSALNQFAGWPKKTTPDYLALNKNLLALRDYLLALNNMPNVAQAEFADASNILQGKLPSNPIIILKKQVQTLPMPLNQWIDGIANNSFFLLLQGAHQTISNTWQATVFPLYRENIQNRYPFSNQIEAFVDLKSFAEFFGNGGVVAQFVQNYLQPFVDTNHANWRLNSFAGYSLQLPQAVLDQLQKIAILRGEFFADGEKTVLSQFIIQPRLLDAQSSSVFLQLRDQTLTYRHGPPQVYNWHWSAADASQQVTISFSDFQGKNYSYSFDGPWAWLKLLHTGKLETTDLPGHIIWTITQDKHQASFDIWTNNNLPAVDFTLLQNFSLPENI